MSAPDDLVELAAELVQTLAPDQGETAHPAFKLAVRLHSCIQSDASRLSAYEDRIRELEGALRDAIPALEQDWEAANDCADEAWCDRSWNHLRQARSLIKEGS